MDGRKADRPSRITIEHTANGGHVVEHYFDNNGKGESYRMPEKHAFGNHSALMTHLRKHTAPQGANPAIETSGVAGASDAKTSPAGVGRKTTAKAPGPRTFGAGVD